MRAADLYELPKEAIEAINEARRQAQIMRVELDRMKALGQDVSGQEQQLHSMEAQLALMTEHYGPGSRQRWAARTRNGA